MGDIVARKLRKEDILCALNRHAVDDHFTAHRCLPEGHVEYMVQTERNQRALDHAVDPGAGVARFENQSAQRGNTRLYERPEVEHADADEQIDGGADDGNKAGAAEE